MQQKEAIEKLRQGQDSLFSIEAFEKYSGLTTFLDPNKKTEAEQEHDAGVRNTIRAMSIIEHDMEAWRDNYQKDIGPAFSKLIQEAIQNPQMDHAWDTLEDHFRSYEKKPEEDSFITAEDRQNSLTALEDHLSRTDLGYYAADKSLPDFCYMTTGELCALQDKIEHPSQSMLSEGLSLHRRDALLAENEIYARQSRAAVQDTIDQLWLKVRKDPKELGCLKKEAYHQIYDELARMPLGSDQTAWQFETLNDLAIAQGLPSHKKELQEILPKSEGLLQPSKHYHATFDGMCRLADLRDNMLKEIRNSKLFQSEQQKIQLYASRFRSGLDSSCKAYCAAVLAPEKKEFDFLLTAHTVADILKTGKFSTREVVESLKEFAPDTPPRIITQGIQEASWHDAFHKQYTPLRTAELSRTYDFGTTMKKLREGDTLPLQNALTKYTQLLAEKVGSKLPEKQGKILKETVASFQKSMNQFIHKTFSKQSLNR